MKGPPLKPGASCKSSRASQTPRLSPKAGLEVMHDSLMECIMHILHSYNFYILLQKKEKLKQHTEQAKSPY